ncbi:MAG: methyltransferase, RsmE family [Bacteroidetes bacterium]|nr:methyltransferase, RsmE family [Bacteroidota bacterium]
MDKTIFYAPEIISNLTLPEEESHHCAKVLRMKAGDPILITDGKGVFYDAVLALPHQKHSSVEIVSQRIVHKYWKPHIHIAFAPTKNMDRTEWFVEKATEIGIDAFTPLLTRYSERKEIKPARIEKILVSAMKQSQKAFLPVLNPMIPFEEFIRHPFSGLKMIAHCHEGDKTLLSKIYTSGEDVLILIGPEGDFSEQEVELALTNAFLPVSLGQSRLRTETAALVACHSIHLLNA